jgi:hypothetical protein
MTNRNSDKSSETASLIKNILQAFKDQGLDEGTLGNFEVFLEYSNLEDPSIPPTGLSMTMMGKYIQGSLFALNLVQNWW